MVEDVTTNGASQATYILVDGSNVAYGSGKWSKPSLTRLVAILENLSQFPFKVVTIVDASLRHAIDDGKGLEQMISEGQILQSPARRDADDFLLQLAQRVQAQGNTVYILTNDTFPQKKLGGTVPRIAFLTVPLGDKEEWLFIPPLETLAAPGDEDVEASEIPEGPAEEPRMPGEEVSIDSALMASLFGFVVTREPALRAGDSIPFAQVAGYLHNQWDGDFCARFGYRKAKDFAIALEGAGLVRVVQKGLPVYLDIEQKLLDECEDHGLEFDATTGETEETTPAEESSGNEMLDRVFQLLREESHLPSEARIQIKLKGIGMSNPGEVSSMLAACVDSGAVVREEGERDTYFWPAGGGWEAVDPNDPDDPYSQELWRDFLLSLEHLSSHQRVAQTRYHLAMHTKAVGMPEVTALPQARLEHMVQLAVAKGILEKVYTIMGTRISVPDHE